MKKIFSAILVLMAAFNAQSQNIAINESGNQPDTSAMLDISSTSRGFLMPRMTKTQRNAIALPATGLLVFQTGPDSTGFHYYNGTQWLWLVTSDIKTAWALTGNNGTDSTINFLGTTDNKPIMLRQNNLPMGQLNSRKHNFFIGGGSGQNNTDERNTGFGDSTLTRNTTGNGNTAIGFRSMAGGTAITGINNTAAGQHSLLEITSGSQNTATGGFAMASMTTGIANVASGVGAMEYTTKGSNNVALGFWALRNADSTNNNVAVGHQALYSSDSSGNTGVGYNVLYYNNRKNNTAVGMQAGAFNNYLQTDQQLGIENTYVGYQSGYYANTGSKNVAIGHRAMLGPGFFNADQPNNNAYKRNVAVGDSALFTNLGNDNVGVGFKTLSKSYSGYGHVAMGSSALTNTTATYPNTAIGFSSQDSNTVGAANTSLGSYSLTKNTAGVNNTAIGNAAMYEAVNDANPTWVTDNTALGNDALRRTRYYGETAIGAGALRNDTGSVYNTAIGYLSMHNHLRGNFNTAVGTNTLRYDSVGISNTAVGMNALMFHKSGDNNTALGVNALYLDSTSNDNVALGTQAMFNHKSGNNNTAVGVNALYSDGTSHANVAVGSHAMFSHQKNNYNTAVGYETMWHDKTGLANTAMGYRTLRYTKNGAENTAIGVGALEFTDSSMYNVAIGRGAMLSKGGLNNTAVGFFSSGAGNFTPTPNLYVKETTTIGAYAGFKNMGDMNTFVGVSAGYGASADSLRGIENTGVGSYTLYYGTTGRSNTTVGIGTLFSNTTGSGNTAVGTRALGYSNGNYNTALGDSAMFNNNANDNVALGAFTLRTNNTGEQNLSAGNYALANNTTGSRNTALGYNALTANVGGASNTAIGYNANAGAGGLTNVSAIGANAYVAQSNSMVLGSINGINGATADTKVGIGISTPDSTLSVANKFSVGSSGTIQYDNNVPVMNYMFKSGNNNANRMLFAHSPGFPNWGLQYQDAGDKFHFVASGVNAVTVDLTNLRMGIGVTNPTYQLHLSTDQAAKLTTSTWSTTSDMRLKTVDGNYTKGLKEIMQLNTIMYHYAKGNARNLATDVQAYGFSAQEVQKVFPEAVTEEKDGYLSLNIHPILISYVNAIKEQQQQIEELKKKVAEKETAKDDAIEKLMKRIEALEAKTATK